MGREHNDIVSNESENNVNDNVIRLTEHGIDGGTDEQ